MTPEDIEAMRADIAETARRCRAAVSYTASPTAQAALEDAARVIETRVPALEAEVLRLRAALKPFADIGVSTDPDYQPMIRLDRDAILAARAALSPALPGGMTAPRGVA